MNRLTPAQQDQLFGDLHNAMERMTRAQTFVPWPGQRVTLQEAIEGVRRIGVFLFPDRWSKYDEPKMPGEA